MSWFIIDSVRTTHKENFMEALHPTQVEILGFIKMHLRRGYAPSMQDISDNTGIPLIRVQYHLDQLERNGHITRKRGQARSIRLPKTAEERADEFLAAWREVTSPEALTREAVIAVFKKMDEVAA